tara:strand:- start:810 stop:1052 length:243 start_codon:yes stop_codon:yes gene_type:complete
VLEEKFGQEFIDCVLGQCKPDCYLCINDNKREEETMPMGKGTYGSQKGRPAKKKMAGKGLTAKQKTLPSALQKKIMKKKK